MFNPNDILYEDNHLLVVNKRAGDLVQPDRDTEAALENEIKAFIKKLHKAGKVEVLNIYKMGVDYFTNKDDIHKTRISAWVGIA